MTQSEAIPDEQPRQQQPVQGEDHGTNMTQPTPSTPEEGTEENPANDHDDDEVVGNESAPPQRQGDPTAGTKDWWNCGEDTIDNACMNGDWWEREEAKEEVKGVAPDDANLPPVLSQQPPHPTDDQPRSTTASSGNQQPFDLHHHDTHNNDNGDCHSLAKSTTSTGGRKPGFEREHVCCPLWTRLTEGLLHGTIRKVIVALSVWSARRAWLVILATFLFTFALAVAGVLTNSELVFDNKAMFSPVHTRPYHEGQWLDHESNFIDTEDIILLIHASGGNILTVEATRRALAAIDEVRQTPGWDDLCAQSQSIDPVSDEPACAVWSATWYWYNNATIFDEQVHSDHDLIAALSQSHFPNTGIPIFHDLLLGKPQWSTTTTTTSTSASSTTTATNTNALHHYNLTNNTNDHADWWYTEKTQLNQSTAANGLGGARRHLDTNNQTSSLLTFAPVYMISIGLPTVSPDAEDFQQAALDRLYQLQQEWRSSNQPYQLEFFCQYAYDLEYQRALNGDMPLVPVVFFIMLGFTCFIFHLEGGIRAGGRTCCAATSRFPLGLASVITIGLAMISGFGIMGCIGVPFTNMTLMCPFLILGVGLDDTFVITGVYFRRLAAKLARDERYQFRQQAKADSVPHDEQQQEHVYDEHESKQQQTLQHSYVDAASNGVAQEPQDESKTRVLSDATKAALETDEQERLAAVATRMLVVEYVRDTMGEVALSITMTTTTTAFAFMCGSTSSIPGISWLCIYASVTIVFDFFYQVTFFIAWLALDERRVARVQRKEAREAQQRRLEASGGDEETSQRCCASSRRANDETSVESGAGRSTFFMDRFMRWYAKQVLRPAFKVMVLVVSIIFFGVCIWSTTQMTQEFNVEDYVPADSYTRSFFNAMDKWGSMVVSIGIYFRDVDQGDPNIQKQMRDFIDDIAALPQIGKPPDYCWVKDLDAVLNGGEIANVDAAFAEQAASLAAELNKLNFTFEQKLDVALKIPAVREVYRSDIVRDENGTITASRCYISIRKLDLKNVQDQVQMLNDQNAVTAAQPINNISEEAEKDWPFFTFSDLYYFFELYVVAVDELILNTIASIVSVIVIGFLMIPHWTATLFVGPLILVLYFELLGVMQFAGIHINAVTYVTVVISIGLLVDFVMHILLRYYETNGKTRDAKVKETLETMGASMMLGGFTTWLGVIPLVFSSTHIFMTVFIAFFAMVTLGLLVGLVLLPVLLSYCGPLVCTYVHSNRFDSTMRESESNQSEDLAEGDLSVINDDANLDKSKSHCQLPVDEGNPGTDISSALGVLQDGTPLFQHVEVAAA